MAHMDPYAALLEHVGNHRFYGAEPNSVQVLKQRDLPGHRLYAVTFTTQDGHAGFCACEVRQQEGGLWSVHGSAGGGRHVHPRAAPWVNLGGSPGQQSSGCYFGGFVESDPAGEIARVRLVSADGVILEDTLDEGVVLFLGERGVRLPLSTELYDQAGKLVVTASWPTSELPSHV